MWRGSDACAIASVPIRNVETLYMNEALLPRFDFARGGRFLNRVATCPPLETIRGSSLLATVASCSFSSASGFLGTTPRTWQDRARFVRLLFLHFRCISRCQGPRTGQNRPRRAVEATSLSLVGLRQSAPLLSDESWCPVLLLTG